MTREEALAELKDTTKGSYYQCRMETYEMASKHGTAVPERRTSMIKGKFAATIEIDIAVDENTPGLLPFEKLKEAVHNEMEAAVNDMLCEEFGDIATVKVTKSFADLYRTEEGADNEP